MNSFIYFYKNIFNLCLKKTQEKNKVHLLFSVHLKYAFKRLHFYSPETPFLSKQQPKCLQKYTLFIYYVTFFV